MAILLTPNCAYPHLPIPTLSQLHLFVSVFLKNPQSAIHSCHMLLGLGPFTGAWPINKEPSGNSYFLFQQSSDAASSFLPMLQCWLADSCTHLVQATPSELVSTVALCVLKPPTPGSPPLSFKPLLHDGL